MLRTLLAVVPGRPSPHCRQIPGSHYVSYRNDFGPDDKAGYLAGERAQRFPEALRYNPFGYNDPYTKIQVVLPAGLVQPNPPAREVGHPPWAMTLYQSPAAGGADDQPVDEGHAHSP